MMLWWYIDHKLVNIPLIWSLNYTGHYTKLTNTIHWSLRYCCHYTTLVTTIMVWASTRKCVSPPWQKYKNLLWFSATFLVKYKSRSWKISSVWSIKTIGELYSTSNEGKNMVSKVRFFFLKLNFIEIWNVHLFQQVKTTSWIKFWYE